MVYVFFLGGDPQRPVYFAAVAEPNAAGRVDQGNVPVTSGQAGPVVSQNTPSQNTAATNISPSSDLQSLLATLPEGSGALETTLNPLTKQEIQDNVNGWQNANPSTYAADQKGNLVYASLVPDGKGGYDPEIVSAQELSNLIVKAQELAKTDPTKQVLVDYYTGLTQKPLSNAAAIELSGKILSKH
jgi:hypothetical protein